jgi:hypothetical protein
MASPDSKKQELPEKTKKKLEEKKRLLAEKLKENMSRRKAAKTQE